MTKQDGKTVLITGSSQTGKTTLYHNMTKGLPRFIVYDPKCHPKDYPGVVEYKSIHLLAERMLDNAGGMFRGRFCDKPKRDFNLICEAAQDWVERFGPATVGVDELAEVTHAGKAGENYGTLVRTSKGFGCNLFVMTQSLMESDKSCIRNHDSIICFYLARDDDRKYTANLMDIDPALINNLKPYQAIVKEHLQAPVYLNTTTLETTPIN